MKRGRNSGSGAAAKRSKAQDPLAAKIAVVTDALRDFSPALPEAAHAMVVQTLPLSLGVPADARHSFQEEMITIVGAALRTTADGLMAQAAEAVANGAAATEAHGQARVAAEAAETTLEAARKTRQEHKVTLADAAVAYQAAKAAHGMAQDRQVLELQQVDAAAGTRAVIGGFAQRISSGELEDLEATLSALDAHLGLERSLRTALPGALRKAPAARGGFDVMAVGQLEQRIETHLKALASTIEQAEPKRAALAGEVAAAAEALDAAGQRQQDCAKRFIAANEAFEAAGAAAQAAQREVKAAATRQRAADRAAQETRAEVELFNDGPLAHFEALRTRRTPTPEAPLADTVSTQGEAARCSPEEEGPEAKIAKISLVPAQ